MAKILLFVLFIPIMAFDCNSNKLNATYQIDELNMEPKLSDKLFYFAFYNCENLFDNIDDPITRDSEFLPYGSKKWSQTKFEQKLTNISRVINSMNDNNGPDIIGLAEVENYNVLKKLNDEFLHKDVYDIIHFDSDDLRGIDVAMLYKKNVFKLISKSIYKIDLGVNQDPTRDILVVDFKYDNRNFTVIANHWPSRRDGQAASEHKRFKAAEVCANIIDSIYKDDPMSDIIMIGDFNDEPFDRSMVEVMDANKYIEGKEFSHRMINTSWGLTSNNRLGTHFYDNKWNILDQILFSKGLLHSPGLVIHDKSAQIFAPDFLRDDFDKKNRPPYRTFAGNEFIKGYSDHFPVFIKVGWVD
ncbi:MAG: hypothetical protein IPP08_02955 [Chlorobiota bacterium]|nr:hypothetical protein [Chlorobiota bacterium]QQS67145.1 MAG: hypothetical protein IPP08_02955 [Chlorobiota bacterium]